MIHKMIETLQGKNHNSTTRLIAGVTALAAVLVAGTLALGNCNIAFASKETTA